MSEPQARDNGLSAESYAPVADLRPHLVGETLDALREAGIAAYAAADRLYVDAAMKRRAEQVLLDRLPPATVDDGGLTSSDLAPNDPASGGPPPDGPAAGDPGIGDGDKDLAERDEDAIWAEIVASYDKETAPGHDAAPPWPEEENVPRAADDARDPDAAADDGAGQDRSGRLPTARVIKPADDELPDDLPDDDAMFEDDGDEGHFVPPPPPPLPSADPATKSAWIALFGGPLYLLTAAILNWQIPGWAAFLAVAAFVGGFVALVLRMGDDPRDPDDGAVV